MWANARQPSPGACSADGVCDNGGDAICCGVCCADGGICSPSSDLRVARPHVEAGSFWAGRLGLGCVVGERVGDPWLGWLVQVFGDLLCSRAVVVDCLESRGRL